MKERGPTKLDQARAMREARYSVEPVRIAVSAEAIHQQMAREGMTAKPKTTDMGNPILPVAAPWLAHEGQCASCDKRRAALKATMRKRRKAPTPA